MPDHGTPLRQPPLPLQLEGDEINDKSRNKDSTVLNRSKAVERMDGLVCRNGDRHWKQVRHVYKHSLRVPFFTFFRFLLVSPPPFCALGLLQELHIYISVCKRHRGEPVSICLQSELSLILKQSVPVVCMELSTIGETRKRNVVNLKENG